MEKNVPRIVLAGTNSGCGKTTVSCAVLQALVNRGMKVGAFKCGPDYIDPMFHSRIIGAQSANLDSFFFSENTLNELLSINAQDINIIEGVMGYYDGLDMLEGRASTYEVAKLTESPVVLVVGAKGASLSVIAVIQGFLSLMPENGIQGVILNQCTAMTYKILSKEILRRFEGRVKPLGFLPSLPDCALESRHLGLITAAEITDLKDKLQRMAEQAEQSINLDGLLELAAQAAPVQYDPTPIPQFAQSVRIAVAKDNAFCFYYGDSLAMLERMGAELVPFSPLSDSALPENIQGLYLGGGYPELYTEALSRNTSMLVSIRSALEQGLPTIAECGGFMYLHERIGEAPMVGFLPGNSFDTGRLVRFGYITLEAKQDCLLCKAGGSIPAHEFHHWDCGDPGSAFTARKPSGRSWDCAIATPRLYAGFPHFHFYANPHFAESFYQACLEEKNHAGKHQTHGY